MSRLRWIKAQLGRKPGADAELSRCLTVGDLPGGVWRMTDQRTWRTGASSAAEPWAAAARDAGSVTAWRSFAATDAERRLWVQLVPLAGIEYGQAALAAVSRSELRNLRAKVSVVGTAEVHPTPSVPGAALVSATEQHTRSSTDDGTVLILRLVVGANLVVMSASSLGTASTWTWPELLALATVQAHKVSA